jgi:hypothetical protein
MTLLGPLSLSRESLPALAALCGSLVGALSSSVSTWITQSRQDRRDLLARKVFHREQLYSDFISESARVLVDALENDFKDPNKLMPAYALRSRIRLSSSREVLASADAVVKRIINAYSEPNLTPDQIRARALSGEDPLKEFSEICRAELDSMQRGM